MESMTPRERMMVALRNQQPDRIPVAPDISNMLPCRRTGKPFWEIYENENPPLWRAYIDAVKYYGMDGWFTYGDLKYKTVSPVEVDREIISKGQRRWEIKNTYHTPDGDLMAIIASPKADAPTCVEKVIKDFEKDFKKFRHFFSDVTGYDDTVFRMQKGNWGNWG